LAQTSYAKDCNLFKSYIKQELTENEYTPQALYLYSEQLLNQRKPLLAKKELEFLVIYYAESTVTIPAEILLKQIHERLAK